MSATNKDNTRAEEFKRATAGVLRAIADMPDVQVAFQPGPSGLSGKRARLPLPTRALPPAEMARLRGASDALALRLRHHDDALARRPHAGAPRGEGRVRRARTGARRGRRLAPHGGRGGQPAVEAGRGVRGRRLRPHDAQGPVADPGGAVAARARADVRAKSPRRRRSASWTCGATRWAKRRTRRWPR